MSTNYFYGTLQVVEFMNKVKILDTFELNPLERFIGTYSDFPGQGMFLQLLCKALSHFVTYTEYEIPTFEQSSQVIEEYRRVMNEIIDGDASLSEDEVINMTQSRCDAPNDAHTFIHEFSRTGTWMSDFTAAVTFFRASEYPAHIQLIRNLIPSLIREGRL